jgi:hypothetical protein
MTKQKLHTSGRTTKVPATRETASGRGPNPGQSGIEDVQSQATGEDAAVDDPKIMDQRLDARPFSTGRKIENQVPHDDEVTERMVEEGVDEADSDERKVASKVGTKSEG